jgi:hypothetical protein
LIEESLRNEKKTPWKSDAGSSDNENDQNVEYNYKDIDLNLKMMNNEVYSNKNNRDMINQYTFQPAINNLYS